MRIPPEYPDALDEAILTLYHDPTRHGLPPLPYLGSQMAYIRDDPNLAYV